jgi:hypothetical protein
MRRVVGLKTPSRPSGFEGSKSRCTTQPSRADACSSRRHGARYASRRRSQGVRRRRVEPGFSEGLRLRQCRPLLPTSTCGRDRRSLISRPGSTSCHLKNSRSSARLRTACGGASRSGRARPKQRAL